LNNFCLYFETEEVGDDVIYSLRGVNQNSLRIHGAKRETLSLYNQSIGVKGEILTLTIGDNQEKNISEVNKNSSSLRE
jgi:hypothetical protein